MKGQINYKTIALARESRGYTQTELSEAMGVQQSIVSKLESGALIPDDKYVNKLVEILKYPRNFFYQQIEIYPPNLHYRKRADVPSKIKGMAEATMNIYRSNLDVLLKGVELPDGGIPILDDYRTENPIEVATFMRHYWNIPKGRIENLTQLLEDKGIMVIHCDFFTDKIDGRSMVTSKGNFIIFINKNKPGDRQRYTLAHEFAHIVLHIHSQHSLDRDIEHDANLFACEFLMPSQEIAPQIAGSKLTIPKLADLKRFWKVSMQAILKWADHLNLVTKSHARYLWSQFNSLSIRLKEPVEVAKEKTALLEKVINAYLFDLRYTKQALADLLCLNIAEFESRFTIEQVPLRILR